MSKHKKYVPKHRSAPERVPRGALPPVLRNGLAMTSVAAAVTGVAVAGGMVGSAPGVTAAGHDLGNDVSAGLGAAPAGGEVSAETSVRGRGPVSRSADRRRVVVPDKADTLSADGGPARTASVELSDGDPRDIARALLSKYGFSADQFGCLDSLWVKESNWRIDADNPTSSAYGIPQALTATHDLPADYTTNPVTQIEWGLDYIQDRYGSPCGAWGHSQSHGWY